MRVLVVVCSYPKNIGHALGAGSGKTHGTVGGERSGESGNTNNGLRRMENPYSVFQAQGKYV
jgi:hypothetical protein